MLFHSFSRNPRNKVRRANYCPQYDYKYFRSFGNQGGRIQVINNHGYSNYCGQKMCLFLPINHKITVPASEVYLLFIYDKKS